MFKVRAVVLVDGSLKFDMKALATGTFISAHTTIKASTMSTLDGATEVAQDPHGVEAQHLRDELLVKKNALINENLTVEAEDQGRQGRQVPQELLLQGQRHRQWALRRQGI